MATSLSELYNKAVHTFQPLYASIELTYKCNLACRFCYNPVDRTNQERAKPAPAPPATPLVFDEIVGLLDELRKMGTLYLTLTGGEPLVHPRFWDIARAARERTFALRIFTNGALIDERTADRLYDLAPYCLEISIHGASPETAQALNQRPGAHQRLMKALALLSERGIRVYLKCVVTRLVESELEEIKAIGDRFGYPVFFDPVLTLSDDGQDYPLDLKASDAAIRRLYSRNGLNIGNSPFEREPDSLNCAVGTGTLHVTPYGDVQPCTQWKESAGNIRDRSLAEIWNDSPIVKHAREVAKAMPRLIKAGTDKHAFCHHCPGLSLLRYGDATRLDEQYLRVAKIRSEVADREKGLGIVTPVTKVKTSKD
ncbi:MAG: radical SAM protein [Acidobacteriota bacterium]|jgi:mycofactocin biosynthetic radical S-adenosylmethionine protein MftC